MVDYATTIKSDEGFSETIYKCSEDFWTIGYGRNLEANGISQDEAEYLLQNDINMAEKQATSLVNDFDGLNDNRKIVLVSMVFQMGRAGVARFAKMLDAIDRNAFRSASDEMLDSKWAKQTPNRANRLAELMRG
jgi:lysozyme